MTPASFGVLDLSVVTDLLVQTINSYWPTSPLWATLSSHVPFTVNVTGLTPDEVRNASGTGGNGSECQLSVSLIHIEPEKYNRNFVYPPPAQPPVSNPPSPRAQAIPQLPLALNLFYFVTAYSKGNYTQEQQAMSIVLNCFHQNPILRTNVVFGGSPPQSTQEEFTLTMEIESVDSISRFWQALTVSFRLSLLYKVSVVFMTPPAPPPPAKQVGRFSLAVESASFPFARNGQLFGTASSTSFIAPDSTPGNLNTVGVDYSPATVTPGQRFFVHGAGLNQGTDYSGPAPNPGTSHRVYLRLPPDYQAEIEVTVPWKAPDSGSPGTAIQTDHRMVLDVPATVGIPLPGKTPPPGFYLLQAGSDAGPDAITNRTNSTPFSIAARVNAPAPPALPILPSVGGTYTVTGMGFIAGSTEVLLETIGLSYVATPPLSPGQFTVIDIATLAFQRPASLPSGLYGIRIRVNQVESPPALWIRF